MKQIIKKILKEIEKKGLKHKDWYLFTGIDFETECELCGRDTNYRFHKIDYDEDWLKEVDWDELAEMQNTAICFKCFRKINIVERDLWNEEFAEGYDYQQPVKYKTKIYFPIVVLHFKCGQILEIETEPWEDYEIIRKEIDETIKLHLKFHEI